MKKFTESYKHYKDISDLGHYRFCWIPLGKKGKGFYSVIEFFDHELKFIDKKKCEILIY